MSVVGGDAGWVPFYSFLLVCYVTFRSVGSCLCSQCDGLYVMGAAAATAWCRFIRTEADDAEDSWEVRLAKR